VVRVQDLNFEFQTLFHKSGTGECRNFKFDVQIDLGKSRLTRDKISPKGLRSLVEFLNFNTPYLNLRRVKLEASNLVYG